MRIEDHWHDAVEYYVSFETTHGRTIRKHLILFEDLTDVEIKSIVSERFNAVKEVINIEEINDVLFPKSSMELIGNN